jgi:hypothetical protein
MHSMILIVFRAFKTCFSKSITSVLFIFYLAATTQAQSLIPELSFRNPTLKTGNGCPGDGLDGAVYIFNNVGWGMDALVTVMGRSNMAVTLTSADIPGPEQDHEQGTGFDNAWQPGISFGGGQAPAHQSWWMEFRISFVSHVDRESFMPVNQFFVSGLDIDGDGNQLHEFQAYYKTQSYTLDNPSVIFASTVQGSETDPMLKGKRFDGTVKDYSGIAGTAENAMVSNFYSGCASLVVRLGAETGSRASDKASRKYGLLFKSMAYGVPLITKARVNLVASGGQMKIKVSRYQYVVN